MAVYPEEVLTFWFEELAPEKQFMKDTAVDETIQRRFLPTLQAAAKNELSHWRGAALGRLAEIIVLDQFPRNCFRDSPMAFAQDPQALALAQEALSRAADRELTPVQKAFLFMPFMHSESPLIHRRALELFSQPGLENNLRFEVAHKEIIDRFGRYPHRNEVLGRESTPEELEFLKTHSGF